MNRCASFLYVKELQSGSLFWLCIFFWNNGAETVSIIRTNSDTQDSALILLLQFDMSEFNEANWSPTAFCCHKCIKSPFRSLFHLYLHEVRNLISDVRKMIPSVPVFIFGICIRFSCINVFVYIKAILEVAQINVSICLVCFLLNCIVPFSLKRYAKHFVELPFTLCV